MQKKVIIAVAAAAIVVAGLYGYSKMSKNKADQAVKDYLEQNSTSNLTPETNNQAGSKEPGVALSGQVQLTPDNTKLAWIGRKTLVVGYEDAGSIQVKSGSAEIKDGKVVLAKATIDMASIAVLNTGKGSGEDRLSSHLKSEDFFDVEKYPTSELNINEVKLISESQGVQNYEFSGTLTMKGVTAAVNLPGKVTLNGNMAALEGETKLDRTKWGVNYGSSKLADSFVDDLFTLKISVSGEIK